MLSLAIRTVQFTLIELMIILAVISILVSLLMPGMSESKIKAKLPPARATSKPSVRPPTPTRTTTTVAS